MLSDTDMSHVGLACSVD